MTGLKRLDLSYNELTALPDWICRMTGLKRLTLEYNGLTALPEELIALGTESDFHAARSSRAR
jgi:Leucine-rich repeat (LRR) protein